ncbi:hypothetical protein IC235_07630 [Hymenobacter sp. BT664]|uniref:Uncharacterized protein n=1 Tax=Hymenobacter montanus TaxID=2771359 RepID=A0A927BCI3_9BACT|nr:hypothetical protein [Hymenobacter montanus]MBD2767760.1 hypothetical protein [Hymenobacter montanus]
MRKYEMTEEQLQKRAQIIRVLANAGWQGPQRAKAFERGELCIPEAVMEYRSETMDIESAYVAEYNYILLDAHEKSGRGIRFAVYFKDRLETLLNLIIRLQDSSTLTDCKKYIKELLQVFPSNVYVAKDEEFVELTKSLSNWLEKQ